MSKFDFVKREAIEERVDIAYKTSIQLQDTIKYLKQVRSFNELSEEEFRILEEANKILIKAMENMENALEEE